MDKVTLSKPIIKRELRGSGYRWEMRDNRFVVIGTKKNIEIILTKVGAMSLMKFLPNYLDKMRIEDNKKLREQIANMREKSKMKKAKKYKAVTEERLPSNEKQTV